jgi:hypothetical protein
MSRVSFRVCVVFQDAIRRIPYEEIEEVGGGDGPTVVGGAWQLTLPSMLRSSYLLQGYDLRQRLQVPLNER